MRKFTPFLAAAMVMVASSQLTAQSAADPAEGQALAAEHCASCHDINPGGAFKTMPPSFASIAAFRSPDEIPTRILWPVMHSRMPQLNTWLTAQEVADLAAYIVSLDTD
jgi:mono/diheme cytochrome c family protein